ncbi:MAG: SDR family oxidoreductase [Spirochaetes bacterium]|nr:SDR family oxidoreductase [Spirochaetota bacterium]
MQLKSKAVYITGGSSGIGLACAEQCAGSGASIAIFARDKKRLRDALDSIEKHRISDGQRIKGYSLDVSEPDDVDRVMRNAVSEIGPPFILINSAGLGGAYHFEVLPYRRFDQTMKINVYGIRNTVAALLPHMKGGGGHIANVSSIGGVIGVFGYSAYSASKFAVIGMSECLRSELKRYGINVSVLLPPDTDTPMMRSEDATKPEETKAINKSGGLVSAEFVASALIRGLEKRRFMIIPGFKGRMIVLLKRILPAIPEAVMDRTIRKVQTG